MAQQVVAAPLVEGSAYATCKLTLVNTGRSDSVIKVHPAEHLSEKIFLDNTQGIERWQAIERLMQGYAKRGTMVAKPVEYHQFPDLKTVVITEDDIPTVELEGTVFAAPVVEKRIADMPAPLPQGVVALENRVAGLEKSLSTTNELLTRLVLQLPAPSPAVAPAPAQQPAFIAKMESEIEAEIDKELTETPNVPVSELNCCGKTFKNKNGLTGHKYSKHGGK